MHINIKMKTYILAMPGKKKTLEFAMCLDKKIAKHKASSKREALEYFLTSAPSKVHLFTHKNNTVLVVPRSSLLKKSHFLMAPDENMKSAQDKYKQKNMITKIAGAILASGAAGLTMHQVHQRLTHKMNKVTPSSHFQAPSSSPPPPPPSSWSIQSYFATTGACVEAISVLGKKDPKLLFQLFFGRKLNNTESYPTEWSKKEITNLLAKDDVVAKLRAFSAESCLDDIKSLDKQEMHELLTGTDAKCKHKDLTEALIVNIYQYFHEPWKTQLQKLLEKQVVLEENTDERREIEAKINACHETATISIRELCSNKCLFARTQHNQVIYEKLFPGYRLEKYPADFSTVGDVITWAVGIYPHAQILFARKCTDVRMWYTAYKNAILNKEKITEFVSNGGYFLDKKYPDKFDSKIKELEFLLSVTERMNMLQAVCKMGQAGKLDVVLLQLEPTQILNIAQLPEWQDIVKVEQWMRQPVAERLTARYMCLSRYALVGKITPLQLLNTVELYFCPENWDDVFLIGKWLRNSYRSEEICNNDVLELINSFGIYFYIRDECLRLAPKLIKIDPKHAKIYAPFSAGVDLLKNITTLCQELQTEYVKYQTLTRGMYKKYNLNTDSPDADIRRAYRQEKAVHHPDKKGDSQAFIQIETAAEKMKTHRREIEDLAFQAEEEQSSIPDTSSTTNFCRTAETTIPQKMLL
jgi:hypothetical protein